jgi:TorA maturation chaperone TorD
MRWIPQFTQDMEGAADSLLYRTLAQVTRDFVMTECNFLDGAPRAEPMVFCAGG